MRSSHGSLGHEDYSPLPPRVPIEKINGPPAAVVLWEARLVCAARYVQRLAHGVLGLSLINAGACQAA